MSVSVLGNLSLKSIQKALSLAFAVLFLAFLLIHAQALSCCADELTLTADSLSYDPGTLSITALKNVHFKHPDGELFGDKGTGYTDGRDFEMRGNVRGVFKKESLNISCYHLKLQTDSENTKKRRVTAAGGVKLTRGSDKLAAKSVVWVVDSDRYKATGSVLASFDSHFIDADEAARDGEKFWARGIRKYEERSKQFSMSAERANGLMKKGDVVELTATGSLVLKMADDKGKVTKVTGDKGIFSKARGTLVVTGNATAVQEGRSLTADSVVYWLESKKIEALGNAKMILEKLT